MHAFLTAQQLLLLPLCVAKLRIPAKDSRGRGARRARSRTSQEAETSPRRAPFLGAPTRGRRHEATASQLWVDGVK